MVRQAFTNVSATPLCTGKDLPKVMNSGAWELFSYANVLLLEVTTNAGQKIETLIGLASDTNYITYHAARRLNLGSERVTQDHGI